MRCPDFSRSAFLCHLRALCLLSLLCLPCVLDHAAQAQQPADPRAAELRAKFERDLKEIAARFDGAMGIAVKDLTGGETFLVNADTVFPQASTIKIPILLELLRQDQAGTLQLSERIELKRAQKVGGDGVLQHFGDGTSALSLRDLAMLMIVLSDNMATNILIERVGFENVNELLRRLGLRETKLQRRMMDSEARRQGRENLSTPREMVALLGQLHAGKILDAAHTSLALEILKYSKTTSLRRGLPSNIELADKPGGIPGVACDSGIVFLPGRLYAIAVMTTYGSGEEAAGQAITEVSRRAFAYFERLTRSNTYGARLP